MKFKSPIKILTLIVWCLIGLTYSAYANESAGAIQNTTLWQFIEAGGWTMVVLGLVSVLAGSIIVYDFLTLKSEKLVPVEFSETLVQKLEAQDTHAARLMCEKDKNIISAIAIAGLDRRTKGKTIMREAMENKARKEIGKLWQNIAFLGDIATIAPLLGLLGTVLGMIQAFNVISFAGSSLKPIMLVGGISKSLVCTAAGLVIAIPCMSCYSFFRAKVQSISDHVESYSADIMRLIEDPQTFKKSDA